MYKRALKKSISKKMFRGKAVIITGARQTGKTTLAEEIVRESVQAAERVTFNCDNPTDRELLNNRDIEFLSQLIGQAKVIFVDEGQKVKSIGQTLKLLVDHYKNKKQIIVTGSSSVNLLDNTQEALTGRKYVFTLFPLSFEELFPDGNSLLAYKEIKNLMIYGSYPDVANQKAFESKREILQELSSSYLYKDIFEMQHIKRSDILHSLLKALALQIGSEASYNELANLLGIDKKTVEHYIDLLEKNYVIFRLSTYAKNKRRELSRLKKIYFYDLGIRNAIINNFNLLDSRSDVGALWENLMILERIKYSSYRGQYLSRYFWRTYDGSEVDYIEEQRGKLEGFEFKWSEKAKKTRIPSKWLEYPKSSYKIITPKDLKGFVFKGSTQ